jgi:hypothetical protein
MREVLFDISETLSPVELVARWRGRIKIRTLECWRYRKTGPAWQKIGGRVYYPIDFVIEYEEEMCVIPKEKKRAVSVKSASVNGSPAQG